MPRSYLKENEEVFGRNCILAWDGFAFVLVSGQLTVDGKPVFLDEDENPYIEEESKENKQMVTYGTINKDNFRDWLKWIGVNIYTKAEAIKQHDLYLDIYLEQPVILGVPFTSASALEKERPDIYAESFDIFIYKEFKDITNKELFGSGYIDADEDEDHLIGRYLGSVNFNFVK